MNRDSLPRKPRSTISVPPAVTPFLSGSPGTGNPTGWQYGTVSVVQLLPSSSSGSLDLTASDLATSSNRLPTISSEMCAAGAVVSLLIELTRLIS